MAGGGGKRGTLILIVLVCIVTAMGSSYAMLRIMNGGAKSEAASGAKLAEEKRGPVFEVGVFTVDLAPEGATRLLRASVALQTSSDKALKALEERSAELKDIIVTILRGRTASSLTGRQGMDSLRKEICAAVNDRISADAVLDVFFPEFVMQ